jgi:hypothetical protein
MVFRIKLYLLDLKIRVFIHNLLTIDTSNPQAAYVGNPNMFRGAPPIDFAETDLGYVGSQNKFLLKIPQGQITVMLKEVRYS